MVLLALYEMSGPDVRWARSHVHAILKLADTAKPSGILNLPGRLMLRREYDRLILSEEQEAPRPSAFMITVTGPGKVDIPAAGMTLEFRILPGITGIDLLAKNPGQGLFRRGPGSFSADVKDFYAGAIASGHGEWMVRASSRKCSLTQKRL